MRPLTVLFAPREQLCSTRYREDLYLFRQIIHEIGKGANKVIASVGISLRPMKTHIDGICSMARNSKTLGILSFYEFNGVPIVNKPYAVKNCRDRIFILSQLKLHKIPALGVNIHKGSFENLPFPVILKNVQNHGLRRCPTIVAYSTKDIRTNKPILKNELWISQPYIYNSTIIKVYLIGKRILYVKVKKDTSRKFELIDMNNSSFLQPKIKKWCLKIGEIFDLDIYNVEIMKYQSKYWVIDVNDFPAFADLPVAPRMIAEYIINKFNNTFNSK